MGDDRSLFVAAFRFLRFLKCPLPDPVALIGVTNDGDPDTIDDVPGEEDKTEEAPPLVLVDLSLDLEEGLEGGTSVEELGVACARGMGAEDELGENKVVEEEGTLWPPSAVEDVDGEPIRGKELARTRIPAFMSS